jgi:chromosome segregation ATPase
LDFPAVKLKQAPSRDNSDTARLSFLDLFKYIYLDQDDVGSTHMLNIGNPTLEVKNREVLKYIFNVLDSNISDLGVEISEKTKEQNILTGQYHVISNFLTDTDFDSIENIDSEISSIEEETEALSSQLSDLNSRIVGDSALYEGFKDALNTINMNILSYESKKSNSLQNIERFGRLQNDYKNDIDKLKSATQAKDVIGRETESSTTCPICDSRISLIDISEVFSIPEDSKVKQELNSISRRSRDLIQIIADNQ